MKRCDSCSGWGKEQCHVCHGMGWKRYIYNSRDIVVGKNASEQFCRTCNGTGFSSCSQCRGGGLIFTADAMIQD